jgi:hypothetical protein
MVKKNKDFKQLISIIHKLAAPPPPPTNYTGPAPAPSPPPPNLPPPPAPPIGTPLPPDTLASPPDTAPDATPEGAPSTPPASIVKMQTELKNLATAMTAQVNMDELGGSNKSLGPNPTQEQQQALGRMSFADFITQHYTRDSDIPGVEFDWDPNKTKMQDKDPSKITRTNVVMDTMQRIGNPTLPGKKPEFAIDGNWGPRTNASLRNAYAMAFGLLEMSRDFHYQPKAFSQQDLAAMKELIPHSSTEISSADKIKRAGQLANLIHAIRNMYGEVKEHILTKTDFKPYIEGTVPYAKYSPSTAMDPRVVAALNVKFTNMKVTGNIQGKSVTVPISVNDLTNTQTFGDWQKKNMPSMSSTDILNQLKKHLDDINPARGTQQ